MNASLERYRASLSRPTCFVRPSHWRYLGKGPIPPTPDLSLLEGDTALTRLTRKVVMRRFERMAAAAKQRREAEKEQRRQQQQRQRQQQRQQQLAKLSHSRSSSVSRSTTESDSDSDMDTPITSRTRPISRRRPVRISTETLSPTSIASSIGELAVAPTSISPTTALSVDTFGMPVTMEVLRAMSPAAAVDEASVGTLDALPAHLLLQVMASGYLQPVDLENMRRTCGALAFAHPSSQLFLSLPCEAARILVETHTRARKSPAHKSNHRKPKALTAGSEEGDVEEAGAAAGAGAGAGAAASTTTEPSVEELAVHGGAHYVDKLHRLLSVNRRWKELSQAMERKAYHQVQMVTWTRRYLLIRHARAMGNLRRLVSAINSSRDDSAPRTPSRTNGSRRG